MKRDEWVFGFTVAEVFDAAEEKVSHHTERIEWWQAEKERVEAEIKESGLEVRHHQQTGGSRAEVVIDPTLASRLGECERKLESHRQRVEQYRRWVGALRTKGDDDFLELHYDDVQFFGLAEEEGA